MKVLLSILCFFLSFHCLLISIDHRDGGVVHCEGVSSTTIMTGPPDTDWTEAVAANNKIYVAARSPTAAQTSSIFSRSTDGSVSVIAGSVVAGVKDGTGTSAGIASPSSLIFDPRVSKGNDLYFIDKQFSKNSNPHFIRKVDVSTGTVTTVFGNGLECGTPIAPDPSDGSAMQAYICLLSSFVFDNNGNIYLLNDNIVRLFNVDAGTVTTIVGTYRGNPGKPGEYIDSDKGKNAYLEAGVSTLFMNRQQNSDLLWVWSGEYIHRVNISNNDRPVRTYSFALANGFLSSGASTLCLSRYNPSIIYGFSRCSTAADKRRYSGQMVTYDLTTFKQSIIAGTGLDCGISDGANPSFRQPVDCSSSTVNGASEQVLLIEPILKTGESTVVRSLTIGDGGNNNNNPSTTPSPNNPTPPSPSAASSLFLGSTSLIAQIIVFALARIGIFFCF